MGKVDNLIFWASQVAEKAGHYVTTTRVLADLNQQVILGNDLVQAIKNVEEEYGYEDKDDSNRQE